MSPYTIIPILLLLIAAEFVYVIWLDHRQRAADSEEVIQ